MQMKMCSNPRCEQVNPQPLDNFYNEKRAKDGKTGRCKYCIRKIQTKYVQSEKGRETKKRARKRYQESEHGQAVMCAYFQSEKGKAAVKRAKDKYTRSQKNKDAQRRYRLSPKGQAYRLKANQRERQRYPQRVKARKAINHAVEQGLMPPISVQQCQSCGGQAEHYHHHLGYEKIHWLDVVSLCTQCHQALEPHCFS